MMHADRTNRLVLTLFGLLTLLVGAASLAMSVGVFGTGRSHQNLFANQVSDFVGRNGQWLWPVVAIVTLLLAVVALRWIATLLLSTDRTGDVVLPGDRRHGRTVVQSGAIKSAVVAEIDGYRGVDSVKVYLIGDPDVPELVVTVTAEKDTDVAALVRRIEAGAFAHARAALDDPELPIRLDVTVGSHSGSRT